MTAARETQLSQRLEALEGLAVFLDGVVVAGQAVIVALGTWLETNGPLDAAASLREGLDESLTVLTLGLRRALAAGRPVISVDTKKKVKFVYT